MSDINLNTLEDFATLSSSEDLNVSELIAMPEFYRSPGVAYFDQQEHSRYVDEILGFDIENTEKKLDSNDYPHLESWVGLKPEQLQTPYDELLLMTQFLQLRDQEHVVDLGAGYGRLGMVLAQQQPNVSFTGYELVGERVEQGNEVLNRFTSEQVLLTQQNLLEDDFTSTDADVYFVYDFGQKEHLKQTLIQLEEKSFERAFRIVARGRGVRSLIHHEFPRLCHAIDPIHFDTFSVYSTP